MKTALAKIEIETLTQAIAEYGDKAQVDMAIEEMSELTKALCKERRYAMDKGKHAEAMDNVVEEIADVAIMLAQLIIIFDKHGDAQNEIDRKTERLAKRLGLREAAADVAQDTLQPAT